MSAPAEASLALPRSRRGEFLALTKPRLNLLVLATMLAGYYMGSAAGFDPIRLLWAFAGTALVASGASALNQWMERELDARMHRTQGRPLPARRLQPGEALTFGIALIAVGSVVLAARVNLLTAALAGVTCVAYLALYTPLKRVTPLNTIAGAVPGAIPPMMGWTAARGELGPEALALFGILFLWQMPHFLAIAWLYRDDYERGGFRMMSMGEHGARRTGWAATLHALALVPVAALPALLGLAGPIYLVGALALGVGFLVLSVHMAVRCDDVVARRLFRGSLLFLPLLFLLMALDRVGA